MKYELTIESRQAPAGDAGLTERRSKASKFIDRRIAAIKSAQTRRDQELLAMARHALAALEMGNVKLVERELEELLATLQQPGTDSPDSNSPSLRAVR